MLSGRQTPQGGVPGQGPQGATKGTGLAPNIASLLCYICPPITGVIFLLIEKDSNDVKFHAWQSLVLGVSFFALLIALQILGVIMGAIAGPLGLIIGVFVPLVILATAIVWVICLVKSYQGERWRIPVLGDFAAKKAGV